MARPSKTAAIDYTAAHDLTHGLLERAACPDGVAFSLLKDSEKKGLRLRLTKAGGKHWQFETRIKGKLFTRALGEWPAVGLDVARKEAHRLRGLAEQGQDPRELERLQAQRAQAEALRQQARDGAERAAAIAQALTVGEVWANYLEQRRPLWGALHYRDHLTKAAPGGLPSKMGLTKPGPLACLMPLRMVDLTQERIEAWAALEAKTRPTSARLAWRLLKVFLSWCAEQSDYAALMPATNPAKTKKAREALGKAGTKTDNLQKSQLSSWFAAVQQLPNPTIAACLQVMLLTGARPGEVLALRWEDVNTQWKGIAIRDKVEGTREIPLTPYVAHLMASLPRRNEWVFSSPTSASGYLTEPNHPHARACQAAGLEGLTLHGLRRSFKSLNEWLEVPVGVVAQIQGHKPSATAEKHYTVRPLELLALHHERIETWILEQAGIVFDAQAEPGKLRVVAS
jgi:integrase